MSKDEKTVSQSHHKTDPVTENVWNKLNAFTDARVGLGRSGISVPTKHMLAFQLAHAKAIDAVHMSLNKALLSQQLTEQVWSPDDAPIFLHSRAVDRATYLQRPDYGRLLDTTSAALLDEHNRQHPQGYDIVIAVVDGLSALAIEQNTLPFLNALFEQLPLRKLSDSNLSESWSLAPICIIEQGRVAIGDDICQRLNAKCVVVLVGERPGLSSPDSLGLYLTWDAKVGRTDAYRNCISNIRPAGLKYPDAAYKTRYLLREAKKLKLSGIKLKDRSDDDLIIDTSQKTKNFLIE